MPCTLVKAPSVPGREVATPAMHNWLSWQNSLVIFPRRNLRSSEQPVPLRYLAASIAHNPKTRVAGGSRTPTT